MRKTKTVICQHRVSYKEYLILVFPLALSTLTVPLLGAVDTALIEHLNNPSLIAGVAISVVIFNTIYWLFGFLRVSTTGFIAQALCDPKRLHAELWRPMFLAIFIGLIFIIFQTPIFHAAMTFYKPTPAVQYSAEQYYRILIWGAPLMLINYVLLGYLMGRAKAKAILLIQVVVNLLNMVLAFCFVLGFELGVRGAAYATLIAQFSAVLLGVYAVNKYLPKTQSTLTLPALFSGKEIKKMLFVNGDLMIRTLCLLLVTNQFIASGSHIGTDVLAANSVLFQIYYIMAYIYDGFANAASIYSGRAQGEKNLCLYKDILRYAFISCLIVSFILTAIWSIADDFIIRLFTTQFTIVALCHQYGFWLLVFPFLGCAGLIYYGIFAGSGNTGPIRNSMLLSLATWYLSWYYFLPYYGNNGLWLSYILFCVGRSLFLIVYIPQAIKRINR